MQSIRICGTFSTFAYDNSRKEIKLQPSYSRAISSKNAVSVCSFYLFIVAVY